MGASEQAEIYLSTMSEPSLSPRSRRSSRCSPAR